MLDRDDDEELELGRALATPQGFVVPVLHNGPTGRVRLFWTEGSGGRSIEVGAAAGPSAPPELALDADAVLVLGWENDAGGATLQVSRFGAASREPLARSPSLGLERRPFESASLAASGAHVLVAYDTREKDGRTSLALEVLDRQTLTRSRRPLPASKLLPSTAGVGAPRVLARSGGFYLIWTEFGERPEQVEARGLVESGPVRLWVAKLDEVGAREGEPLPLSGDVEDVEYDALVRDDELLALVRTLPAGESELKRLNASGGALEPLRVVAPELAPEPMSLGQVSGSAVVLAESSRGTSLVGFWSGMGGELELTPEPLFRGRDVLGAAENGFLALSGREGEVILELISCEASRRASP